MACPSQTQFFKVTVSYKKGSEVTNCCGFSSGWNCFPKKITHEFGKAELWLFGQTQCVYYEHYLVHKKKETLRLLWKLLGTQKRKLKTLWTLWFTKKVPPQDYELTWYTKNFFRDVMKLLGQPKKIS